MLRSPIALMVLVTCCAVGGAEQPDTQAESDPAGPLQTIPAQEIRKLRAKWIDPEAQATDADKVRRYESILRTGRRLERNHPHAENLYIPRALMIQASRGLLILGAGGVQRDDVIRLAKAVVDSSAPPAWRIESDTLLTQLELAREDDQQQRTETIQRFMGRYESSDTAAAAIMRAADMAQRYQFKDLYKSTIQVLREEYLDHEGVGVFLVSHGQKIPREGRSFSAVVQRFDGEEMVLPLDLMGRVSVVLFWDPRSGNSVTHITTMARKLREEPQPLLQGLSISTDSDRGRVQKVEKEIEADFTTTYLAEEDRSRVMEFLGVNEIPMYFLVGADGRIFDTPRHFHGMWWRGTQDSFIRHLDRVWRAPGRLQLARSGLVLLDPLAQSVGEGLTARIHRIRQILLCRPRGKRRLQAMQEALAKLERQVDDLAGAEADTARLLSIAVARYMAIARGQNRLDASWVAQATKTEAEALPPAAKLLREYILHLDKIHDASQEQADGWIRDFAARYEYDALAPHAKILATCSALEKGLDAPRRNLTAKLSDVGNFDHPVVRGYLRDTLDMHPEIEARMRFELAMTGLDGRTLRLGDGIDGDAIVVHFWSKGAPIASAGIPRRQDPVVSQYALDQAGKGVTIIAVNVDGDQAGARELARKHPDWIHAVCPQGWADPLLRKLGVTQLPSSWVFGYDGGVLVDDSHYDARDALKRRQTMSTWVRYWHAVPVDQWYRRSLRLWTGFQATRAAKALYGEDLFPEKRRKEYQRGFEWITDNGLYHAIRTSADPIHREILSIVEEVPAGQVPSAGARARLARLYRRLEELEPYLDKIQNWIQTSPDWPDDISGEGIDKKRRYIYLLEFRRHRPSKPMREKLDALLRSVDGGWSLRPVPDWMKPPEE
jgi:hypothetical protein